MSERYPSESALHTYNAIITMPLSRTQLAALLIALHESAGCRPPPMSVAWAMCARGRLRALKQLRRIPAFGRRRQTRLRKVFAAPDFHQHLTSQLQVITAQAPDIPEHPPLPNLNLAHPFGEAAWFEPVVARLLGQDGRLLYGRARGLRGFGFCRQIIHYQQAATRPPPLTGIIIGAGYVGLEVALAWARAGTVVVLINKQTELLAGYDAAAVVEVRTLLEAAGVQLMLGTDATGWQSHGDSLTVTIVTGYNMAVVSAEVLLVAAGIIYPKPRSGRAPK